jgi:SAM-dependent methyltransferase
MDLIENNDDINPEIHWYYKEKFNHVVRAIKNVSPDFQTLCDVGAGTAPFSRQLAKLFPTRTFYALDRNYDRRILNTTSQGLTYVSNLKSADVYLLNDVLEHLEKPQELLLEIQKVGSPGSLIIITVPAHMVLWSGHDVFLKHYRRYNRATLFTDLQVLSYIHIYDYFIFNSLFFPAFLKRKFGKTRIQSDMRNFPELLDFIFRILIKIDRLFRHRPRFGLTLFCVIQLEATMD